MGLKDIFVISAGTRKLLVITSSVAVLAILFAVFHYRGVNRSEDPRVAPARQLMARYDKVSGGTDSYDYFCLLDSAAAIYESVPGYEHSWEKGVIFNNRCSGLLVMAIYDSLMNDSLRRSLVDLSMSWCDSSINTYMAWKEEWGSLSEDEVKQKLSSTMHADDPAFTGHNFRTVFGKRVDDVMLAQVEIDRRLSVSYTNKATAYRHLVMQDSAYRYFQEALALWSHNRIAESNLSVLMGGEPVKPGIIESLFPPDRKKRQGKTGMP
ncbi:MAG: hypothetical protein MUE37_04220 [Bacteroidales bacterium]|jgi:hypothetical protein|nr:hypothetical protein [Bacteroidales bacterium]